VQAPHDLSSCVQERFSDRRPTPWPLTGSGILAQVGAWLAQQVADFPDKVASVVRAAAQVLDQFVQWALDLVAAMVNALLSPFYAGLRDEGYRLTASADIATSARNPSQRKDFLLSIWDMVGSGNFFNVVLSLVIALQVVAALAINVILPGGGGVIAKLIETVVMGFAIGFFVSGLTDLLLLGLDAVFQAAVPSSDVFWSEGAGLDVIGVIQDLSSIILGWEKASKPGISVFKTLKNLDAAWLALSLAGLSITLASASWSGWPAIAASAIGLGFGFIGALKAMDEDPIDRIPFAIAPLKYSEEAFSLIGLGYAIADFGNTVSAEL